jgi:YVTN family beta-propeller protein
MRYSAFSNPSPFGVISRAGPVAAPTARSDLPDRIQSYTITAELSRANRFEPGEFKEDEMQERSRLPLAAAMRLAACGALLVALFCACAPQMRTSGEIPVPPSPNTRPIIGKPQGTSQLVLYVREPASSGLPIAWQIRKIALNKADGSQLAVTDAEIVLKTSALEMGAGGNLIQKLVGIVDVPVGDYSGLTFFTRGAYYEDTGNPVPTDAMIIPIDYAFSTVSGASKTIIVVADMAAPGSNRASFRFQPRLTIDQPAVTSRAKLIYVANEGSSTISVIDKALKRVVENVYIGIRPDALGVDQRRNRLYVADRKTGILYEMDMLNLRFSNATQVDYIAEPVRIEPIPAKDLLIVVNYGSDTIQLVDAFNLGVVETLPVGNGPVDAIYSTFAERAFVVNTLVGTLSVIDLETSPAVVDTTIDVELRPSAITTDDAQGLVYVTNSGSTDLSVIKIEPKTFAIAVERTFSIGLGAGDVTLDPFGRKLFVAMTSSHEILCIDPYTGVTVYSVRLPSSPGQLMFDPDEKKLYVTLPSQNAVVVIDAITREIQNWIETGYAPSSIAQRL